MHKHPYVPAQEHNLDNFRARMQERKQRARQEAAELLVRHRAGVYVDRRSDSQ